MVARTTELRHWLAMDVWQSKHSLRTEWQRKPTTTPPQSCGSPATTSTSLAEGGVVACFHYTLYCPSSDCSSADWSNIDAKLKYLRKIPLARLCTSTTSALPTGRRGILIISTLHRQCVYCSIPCIQSSSALRLESATQHAILAGLPLGPPTTHLFSWTIQYVTPLH